MASAPGAVIDPFDESNRSEPEAVESFQAESAPAPVMVATAGSTKRSLDVWMLAGVLIARGRALPVPLWVAIFAVAGFFHGYAFGESIFGAETSPLHAYLLGLILIQGALTVTAALFARRSGGVSELAPRLAGAAIIGVGLTVLIGQLIPGA